MSTTTYTTVALADAQPGDEILAGGTWLPVDAFHLSGTSVKLVFPNGGTQSMPVHHLGKIRRAVPAGDTTATDYLGAHTHYLAGADTRCDQLTHCPSLCACPVDACTAARVAHPASNYCEQCGAYTAGGTCPNVAHQAAATPAAPEFGCYSLNLATGRVCTLEFGHDGAHTAHGMRADFQPDGTYSTSGPVALQTWERAATDRSGSEHEAGAL